MLRSSVLLLLVAAAGVHGLLGLGEEDGLQRREEDLSEAARKHPHRKHHHAAPVPHPKPGHPESKCAGACVVKAIHESGCRSTESHCFCKSPKFLTAADYCDIKECHGKGDIGGLIYELCNHHHPTTTWTHHHRPTPTKHTTEHHHHTTWSPHPYPTPTHTVWP